MDKEANYKEALEEIKAVWDNKIHLTGNLANVCAVLKSKFNFWWVGFYQVYGGELQLGTFQGVAACTRIAKGRGVCGTAWQQAKTVVVPNVHEFDGHIACNAVSNSEIVVPVFGSDGKVWGVLDIDSEHFNHFDQTDKYYLEQICQFIKKQVLKNKKC